MAPASASLRSQDPKAGEDVDAYCAKCKLVLAHTVVAMDGRRIARCQCKTCAASHAFRAAPTSKATRATKAKTSTAGTKTKASTAGTQAKRAADSNDYEALMAGKDISNPEPYRISHTFLAGSVILHKRFGLGVVARLLDDSKIEVAFEEGAKILVHAR